MAHQTVLSFRTPGIPVFKVVVATLPWSRVCKVEEYRDETALALLLPLVELTDKNELLRRRVRDGSEDPSSQINSKLVRLPGKRVSRGAYIN